MGHLTSDKNAEEMRRWMDVIEDFNKREGGDSPYEVKEVREEMDGTTILVLKKRD